MTADQLANTAPIGVFDSGLGGLSVVRHLRKLLPEEEIVYFGDTGRVPYGTRSRETIRRYAGEDCGFLLSHDVKYVIAACGTISSLAPDILADLPVPAHGVVDATARAAVAATKNKHVGVIATAATVQSDSFGKALRQTDPDIHVTAAACPLLVSLVESGWIAPDDAVAVPMVERYVAPMREAGVDTLILGCTHFPLLSPIIARVLGDGVTLIDPGKETAEYCVREMRQRGMLCTSGKGGSRYYVTDRPDNFSQVAEIFLGESVQNEVFLISPDDLRQKGGVL